MAEATALERLGSGKQGQVRKDVVDSLTRKQNETIANMSNHKPKAETMADYLSSLMASQPKELASDLFKECAYYEDRVTNQVDQKLLPIGPKVDKT